MKFTIIAFILCVLCAFVVNSLPLWAADVLTIDSPAVITLENNTAITISGSITGTGTLVFTNAGYMYISGDWGVNSFNQGNSTVYVNETTDTVFYLTPNNRTFYDLIINSDVTTTNTTSDGLIINHNLLIMQGSTLCLGNGLTHNLATTTTVYGTLDLGLSNLIANENLVISSTGTLAMNGQSITQTPQLTMANYKTLEIDGTFKTSWSLSNLKPVITSTGTGNRYSLTINGKIDADGLTIGGLDANGLNIASTADHASDLDNVDFRDVVPGGQHLSLGFTAGTYTGNYDGCSFDQSFGVSTGHNVVCADTSGSTTLYFMNWSGSGSGSAYDLEEGAKTLIHWIETDTMVAHSPASLILESTAAITIPGDFNIDIVTCTGSASIYVTGVWGVITFAPGTSTVYLNGGSQTIGNNTFYNLVISSSDAQSAAGTNIVITDTGSINIIQQTASVPGTYTMANTHLTMGNNSTLSVSTNAQLIATDNTIITTPNPGTDRFSFNVSGTIGLNNCTISSMTDAGLNIQTGATIDELTDVRFFNHRNIANSCYLTINLSGINQDLMNCYFNDTITTGYNISATGTDSVIRCAGNGPGAGHALTNDADKDNDGIADTPEHGAVVLWTSGVVVATESIGGIQGYPIIAFDLNDYEWNYATYVASRDLTGNQTADRLFVLNPDSTVKYYYAVAQSRGDIVSFPWYYTEGTDPDFYHTVYFGTTKGYLYRLIDTGSALTLSTGWPLKVCDEITSGVITDGVNLYFGGILNGQPKIIAYVINSRSRLFALPAESRITATPSWAGDEGTPLLFFGSDYQEMTTGTTTGNIQIDAQHAYLTATSGSFTGIDAGLDVLAITNGAQQGRYRIISIEMVDTVTRVTLALDHTFVPGGAATYSAGQTPLLYKVDVSSQAIVAQNHSALDHLRAPTNFFSDNNSLYCGDYYGRMQGVDAFSTNLDDLSGFPYIPSGTPYSVTSLAWVMESRILYTDMGGNLYDLNTNGTIYDPGNGAYPITLGAGTPIECAPMPNYAGLIYVGNDIGQVFVIDESTKNVIKTYDLGADMKIRGIIIFDLDNNRFLVPTSTGRIYYIDNMTDPTP
jgi:hypothetical protein